MMKQSPYYESIEAKQDEKDEQKEMINESEIIYF